MPASLVRQASLSRPRSKRKPLSDVGLAAQADDLLVVGVGASAGGLDACRKLVEALPPTTNAAWILVQHLDPAHESLLVSLLAGHTRMTVVQAADGMLIEREHLYIIAPGTYLSVADGVLRSSIPQARHGARLPFDFLLHSLESIRLTGSVRCPVRYRRGWQSRFKGDQGARRNYHCPGSA